MKNHLTFIIKVIILLGGVKVDSILLGISASFFFASSFILNRQMDLAGGSWIWSASLRYFFMLPILFVILVFKSQYKTVLKDIVNRPIPWITWSTVGFGLFYAPLCFASAYGSSWLVAGTWQITIVAGALLSPLFFTSTKTKNGVVKSRNRIPKKTLGMSIIILSGIFLMQLQNASGESAFKTLVGIIPVILAAFSYPLGNRKMMEFCGDRCNTLQRVFGMTLSSIPFWILLSIFGVSSFGFPGKSQIVQSLIVAINSGVIATILFFKATDLVKGNMHKLAIVESTQAGEVIFTLLGGLLLFHDSMPTITGFIGIFLVTIGMILNSLMTTKV